MDDCNSNFSFYAAVNFPKKTLFTFACAACNHRRLWHCKKFLIFSVLLLNSMYVNAFYRLVFWDITVPHRVSHENYKFVRLLRQKLYFLCSEDYSPRHSNQSFTYPGLFNAGFITSLACRLENVLDHLIRYTNFYNWIKFNWDLSYYNEKLSKIHCSLLTFPFCFLFFAGTTYLLNLIKHYKPHLRSTNKFEWFTYWEIFSVLCSSMAHLVI